MREAQDAWNQLTAAMYVKRIIYPVNVLGPGCRVGIWVSGCHKNCEGCISPELRKFNEASSVSIDTIMAAVGRVSGVIDGFTISGGEPFLQAAELRELVQRLNESYCDDIIIYSGYTIKELHAFSDNDTEAVLCSISVLIDGEYIEELNDNKGIRGSSNQRVHIFRNAHKYEHLEDCTRSLQSFKFTDEVVVVGIP